MKSCKKNQYTHPFFLDRKMSGTATAVEATDAADFPEEHGGQDDSILSAIQAK